jgi:proline racemase
MVVQSNHPVPRGARRVHADLVWADSTLVAIVDAEAAGAPLVPTRVLELQRAGRELVIALDQGLRVSDPESGSPVSVASVVFIGASPEQGADILSATMMREGHVLRSPGGTTTGAVAAVLSAMGMLVPGQRLVHQGIAGAALAAEISAIGDRDGTAYVTVDVEGAAWPIGRHEFSTSRGDPLAEGVRFA